VVALLPDAGPPTVVGVVAVNKTPVRQAPDDKSKATTQLFRGERVTVLERGDPYCRIQLSDGEAGWAPVKNLLVGQYTEASLVNDQDLYVRPDALSPVRRRAAAGTLLFVLQDKDGWRQVQLADRFQGWVPKDRAVTEGPELEGAQALWKAELLLEQKRLEVARVMLREFLAAHPGTRLAALVETRLAALPPEPGPDASVPAGDGGGAGDSGRSGLAGEGPGAVSAPGVPGATSAGAVTGDAGQPVSSSSAGTGARPMTVMP
jgi:SH3-like domain-containing protein